jgi:phosphatidylglycerol:prolipoprotein diacylglycerol transferase
MNGTDMTIHEDPRAYTLIVVASFALLFVYPASSTIDDPVMRRRYHMVQLMTLLGAAVGAKVALLMGDKGWPMTPLASWWVVVDSGRSITGGLLGGFAAGEVAKPLFRYTLPPNDHFAAKLPFSIGLGRVGCLLGGCCRGLPHDGWLSIRYLDNVPRWPAPLFELAFQLGVGVFFVFLVRRRLLRGRVFCLYLVLYGVFRFATEFLRETPKPIGSMSVYQLLSIVMIALGAVLLVGRTRTLRPLLEASPT